MAPGQGMFTYVRDVIRYMRGTPGASGYESNATAEEVTSGQDLHACTVVITGNTLSRKYFWFSNLFANLTYILKICLRSAGRESRIEAFAMSGDRTGYWEINYSSEAQTVFSFLTMESAMNVTCYGIGSLRVTWCWNNWLSCNGYPYSWNSWSQTFFNLLVNWTCWQIAMRIRLQKVMPRNQSFQIWC